ncbi:MAG: dioxygenase [Proteobacteria bacterium]|nr:dioxygenase [Pseudomonadota bacterium]
MPAYFISHGGGPCFFMDWSPMGPKDTWVKMEAWLRGFRSTLPAMPRALVVLSAHWEESEVTIQKVEAPALIYDYYGFPKHTYSLQYPAKGDARVSDRVKALLDLAAIPNRIDPDRGYDHGIFIPLLLMFPEAEVPVIAVSLKKSLDPRDHLELGKALAPLREEGVLILGSGMSNHNLRALFSGLPTAPGSEEFDQWLRRAVESPAQERNEALAGWSRAPVARLTHLREEHLIPLLVAAGAAGEDPGRLEFSDKIMGAQNSSFSFG